MGSLTKKPSTNATHYAPAGYCIYCGSVEPPLNDEHIVPYGLGGRVVIPDASCNSCQKITCNIEGACLREMLGDIRASSRILGRKRKKKNRYRPRPMIVEIDGVKQTSYATHHDDRIDVTMLPAFAIPSILSGAPFSKPYEAEWYCQSIGQNISKLYPPGAIYHSIRGLHLQHFCKMLAKMAHAYTVAKIGANSLKPLLPGAIIGKEEWQHGYLVGGEPRFVAPSKTQLELGIRKGKGPSGEEYAYARIRLFGHLGAPVYYAVVGKL